MKILKIILLLFIALIILGTGGFFYLGQMSQSGNALGLTGGELSECPPSPNCVSSENGTPAEKLVNPLPVEIWRDLPQALSEMGGVVKTQRDDYISAEFTSKLFGFVDDVEFRLTEDKVHVRSASRVGHSDGGVNAARVAALREKLNI